MKHRRFQGRDGLCGRRGPSKPPRLPGLRRPRRPLRSDAKRAPCEGEGATRAREPCEFRIRLRLAPQAAATSKQTKGSRQANAAAEDPRSRCRRSYAPFGRVFEAALSKTACGAGRFLLWACCCEGRTGVKDDLSVRSYVQLAAKTKQAMKRMIKTVSRQRLDMGDLGHEVVVVVVARLRDAEPLQRRCVRACIGQRSRLSLPPSRALRNDILESSPSAALVVEDDALLLHRTA